MKRLIWLALAVLPLAAFIGCPAANNPAADHEEQSDEHDHGEHDGHAHDVHGPHGGHIIELGNEEYHAELGYDVELGGVGVHILGSDAKTDKAIATETITLVESKDGEFIDHTLTAADFSESASFFQLKDKVLAERIAHDEEFTGRLKIKFGDTSLSGKISHSGHDH